MTTVAIVTGGASGIGAALGAALARRSAHVVLADIDAAGIDQSAQLITESFPGTAESACVDVRDPQAVADLVHDTRRRLGRLDLMFNNAGIAIGGEPEELGLEHWNRAIDVNLRGVIHGCHAAYPVMKDQGGGHIINTASLGGLGPCPGYMAPYSASKFGVVGLSLSLRAAGADYGVRVSVVCPAAVDTPILDQRGPRDLPMPPSVLRFPTARTLFAESHFPAYPPDRMAEDILRGVDRNKAIIVSPFSARLPWLAYRLVPATMLRNAVTMTRRARARTSRADDARLP